MFVRSLGFALMLVSSIAATAHADASDDAAKAAQAAAAAAEAAKQAAEAAKQAAQAVEALSSHVAALEHPAPPTPIPLPPWAWTLGVNALATFGNASAFTGQLTGTAIGHWGDWGAEFKLQAGYGESRPRGGLPAEVTAQNAAVTARGTRGLAEHFAGYIYAGEATDHVASIESQTLGELGAAVVWWEIHVEDYTASLLRTSIGVRGIYETHHQYYPTPASLPSSTIYGPVATLNWRYALSKVTLFTEDADILVDINNTHDVRANSATALVVQLKDGLAMQTGVVIRYIGAPQQGKLSTDTQLTAGLTWAW